MVNRGVIVTIGRLLSRSQPQEPRTRFSTEGTINMTSRTTAVDMVDAGSRQVSRAVLVGASPSDLFAIAADPRRHAELDGSGTVVGNVSVPGAVVEGSRFSTKMRRLGLPYRITSTITRLIPDQVIEWRHPLGHRWRWEFESVAPGLTRVVETFDYRDTGWLKDFIKFYAATGFVKANAAGIESTLLRLRSRYPVR